MGCYRNLNVKQRSVGLRHRFSGAHPRPSATPMPPRSWPAAPTSNASWTAWATPRSKTTQKYLHALPHSDQTNLDPLTGITNTKPKGADQGPLGAGDSQARTGRP